MHQHRSTNHTQDVMTLLTLLVNRCWTKKFQDKVEKVYSVLFLLIVSFSLKIYIYKHFLKMFAKLNVNI